jgi:hypothetical protein
VLAHNSNLSADGCEIPRGGYKQIDWKCGHPRGQCRSNRIEQGTRWHKIKENQNKYQINIITIIGIIIIITIIQNNNTNSRKEIEQNTQIKT